MENLFKTIGEFVEQYIFCLIALELDKFINTNLLESYFGL
jgi:hypothetical protein